MGEGLATIQKIINIESIENSDNILKATVLGWSVVISKKDNFKIGDNIIYIRIDSIMPPTQDFEFLKDRKYRIRTIKLRKTLSQGLILPLSMLPKKNWKEGDDVTDILKITKYDPQRDAENKLMEEKAKREKNKVKKFFMQYSWFRHMFSTKKQGAWPSFIVKTDETRIQNIPWIFEKEKDNIFSYSEKADGQSLTLFLIKNKNKFLWFGQDYIFGVCSRNVWLKTPDNSNWWNMARQIDANNKLKKLIGDKEFVVLQGEIIGDGIQDNNYKLPANTHDFYAFNLIYPDGKVNSVVAEATLKKYDIKFVPILDTNFKLPETMDEALALAKRKSVICKNSLAEGIVVRSHDNRISFKIISNDYLLKHGE